MSLEIFAFVVVPGIALAIAFGGLGIVVLLTREQQPTPHRPAE